MESEDEVGEIKLITIKEGELEESGETVLWLITTSIGMDSRFKHKQ